MPMEVVEYVSILKPEIEQIARDELGEDEQKRNDSVIAIREWLKKQPHLKSLPTGNNTFKYYFPTGHMLSRAFMVLLCNKMLCTCSSTYEAASTVWRKRSKNWIWL